MKQSVRVRGVLFFCLRFTLIAPVVLFVWWSWLLPPYTWVVGQLSGGLINLLVDEPITAMKLFTNPEGVLNADTSLVFYVGEQQRVLHAADLVNSAIPFIILVLATSGLGLRRRTIVLCIGIGILFAGQVAYITGVYVFAKQLADSRDIGIALGQFWLTAPFVMWIVLAYWDRLMGFFDESRNGATPDGDKTAVQDGGG